MSPSSDYVVDTAAQNLQEETVDEAQNSGHSNFKHEDYIYSKTMSQTLKLQILESISTYEAYILIQILAFQSGCDVTLERLQHKGRVVLCMQRTKLYTATRCFVALPLVLFGNSSDHLRLNTTVILSTQDFKES